MRKGREHLEEFSCGLVYEGRRKLYAGERATEFKKLVLPCMPYIKHLVVMPKIKIVFYYFMAAKA